MKKTKMQSRNVVLRVLTRGFEMVRNPLGKLMALAGVFLLLFGTSIVVKADDISDAITSVSGYETDAVVVGTAILLFVLGRRVVRKLIAFAMIGTSAALAWSAFTPNAHATGDDITTVISSVSGYETAAVVVGVAVLLFVLGRRVIRKLI